MKRFIFFVILYGIALGLVTIFPLGLLNAPKTPLESLGKSHVLDSKWQYKSTTDEDWKPIELPCLTSKDPPSRDGFHWFKTNLQAQDYSDAAIYIRATHDPFEVFLGNLKIYSYGFRDGRPDTRFLGSPWHFISIHSSDRSQELTIKTLAAETGKSGICTEIYFGPENAFLRKLSIDGMDRAFVALIAFFLAIISLLLAFSTMTARPFISFSAFSIAMGAWVFSNTSGPAFKYFIYDSPRFWAFCDLAGLFLIPGLLIWFYRDISSGKNRPTMKILHILELVHYAYASGALILSSFLIVSLQSTIRPFNHIVPLLLIIMFIDSLRGLQRKANKTEKMFALGFLFFICFSVHDFLVGIGFLNWERHLGHWGQLGLILCLAWIVSIRLFDQMQVKAQLKEEHARFSAVIQTTQLFSHEIRRPFSMLQSLVDAMGFIDSPETMSSFISTARPKLDDAIRHVDFMIKDFLIIESPDRPLTPIDLEQMIQSEVSLARQSHRENSIRFDINLEHKTHVMADPETLRRAIANLIANAIEATPENGKIWIKTRTSPTRSFNTDEVIVTIGNSGSYIEPADRSLLFDRFFTKGKIKGTGLGLAIVHKVIKAHKGRIWVDSDQHMGTEFHFTLLARPISS